LKTGRIDWRLETVLGKVRRLFVLINLQADHLPKLQVIYLFGCLKLGLIPYIRRSLDSFESGEVTCTNAKGDRPGTCHPATVAEGQRSAGMSASGIGRITLTAVVYRPVPSSINLNENQQRARLFETWRPVCLPFSAVAANQR
jgi:hypothetical protein